MEDFLPIWRSPLLDKISHTVTGIIMNGLFIKINVVDSLVLLDTLDNSNQTQPHLRSCRFVTLYLVPMLILCILFLSPSEDIWFVGAFFLSGRSLVQLGIRYHDYL